MLALALIAGCKPKETAPAKPPTIVIPQDLKGEKINDAIVPSAPKFLDSAMVGTQLAPDGTVAKPNDSVPEGTPVYLTMHFHESPAGLQARAVWKDVLGKEVHHDQHDMKGAKVVTFELNDPKLKPGRYRVIGYWGGNIACDRVFSVVAAQK